MEAEREKNRIRSMAWAFYQVLGTFYGIEGPARIMNWLHDVAAGEDRDVSELFPITPEERAKYEWRACAVDAGGEGMKADNLFGVYCGGNPMNLPNAPQPIFWEGWTRIANFVNRRDAGGEGTGPVAPEGMVLTQRQCIVCLENHTCFTRAVAPPAEPHKCIAEMQLPAGQGFLQCPICGATTGVVPAEPQEER
jgi:hypothetical protein